MEKIFDGSQKIHNAAVYIGFDYISTFCGGTEVIRFNSVVSIKTRYERHIVGILKGFQSATKEGMQDYIIIENQEGKEEKIGIQDIVILECDEYARLV